MVRSSAADSSSVASISSPPKPSRAAQRRMLATQSRASTRSPSCQNRPSRKLRSHCSPSPEMAWPDSICGETWSEELMP